MVNSTRLHRMSQKTIKITVFIVYYLLAFSDSHAAGSDYASPEHVEGAISTTVFDAKDLHEQGAIFIDVRNSRFYARGHIPGAFHLDLKYNFDEAKLSKVAKKNQPIVLYCSGIKCSRSSSAAEQALSWDFTKVYYFRGGISAWRKIGYEEVTGKAE